MLCKKNQQTTFLKKFLFFPESKIWQFIQIDSLGDNLHEIAKPIFWEK